MQQDYQYGISNSPLKEFDHHEIHSSRVQALLDLEEAPLLIKICKHYVLNFIPAPIENEDEYWMSSCFPGDYNTPVRINIFWHEVLNIHATTKNNSSRPSWGLMLFADSNFLPPQEIKRLKRAITGFKTDANFRYDKGLNSQLALFLPITSYFDLVQDEVVYEAIKHYNYQLTCKGRRVHKGHNYELAQLLLAK